MLKSVILAMLLGNVYVNEFRSFSKQNMPHRNCCKHTETHIPSTDVMKTKNGVRLSLSSETQSAALVRKFVSCKMFAFELNTVPSLIVKCVQC